MAVGEWLRMQETDLCSEQIFKLVLKWDMCINAPEDYVKK
jgi:hypothetical protein